MANQLGPPHGGELRRVNPSKSVWNEIPKPQLIDVGPHYWDVHLYTIYSAAQARLAEVELGSGDVLRGDGIFIPNQTLQPKIS